jgi:hypothetical protein
MKIIKVESCRECPYLEHHIEYDEYDCRKEDCFIQKYSIPDFIPTWCPLEEAT